ncbi:jg5931 [Pararge aegeria aegeria]|uniref:Jg5931 protein n=1 Tax=Pararge aegeria aegeria TaxID=348720 RepID=A0A8S4RGN9_9NEOP|nr:jg5931 [Pararge aegeria aegeria]
MFSLHFSCPHKEDRVPTFAVHFVLRDSSSDIKIGNMAEKNMDKSGSDHSDYGNNEVNIDEVLNNQDTVTAICEAVKGLDANRYATKKTVAQGMLDIALLTSNASQLKYVLQVGPKHEFYMLLLVLISISIILQVVSAIAAIVLGFIFDINHQRHHRSAEILNNLSLMFKVISTTVNIVISIFYSIAFDTNSL